MNDISKDKDYQEFFVCTEVTFGAQIIICC